LLRVLKRKKPQKLRLINYYFDDSQLRLRKKKFALRVRIINGKKVYFTLKYPAKAPRNSPSALKIRVEHEEEIPLKIAKHLLKETKKILDVDAVPTRILRRNFSKNSLSKVRPLGLIETERTVVPLYSFLELEIDRCKMFNKKFYEVEVETSQPRRVDKAIRELFSVYDIPYQPLTRSKFGRFIEEWKRRR